MPACPMCPRARRAALPRSLDAMLWFRWLRRAPPPQVRLADLPEDVLSRVFTALMDPVTVGSAARCVEASYRAALPLAQACTRFYAIFHAQLVDCELWQTGRMDDAGLASIARRAGPAVKRMILRKCVRVSVRSLTVLAERCTRIRTVDLSYVDVSDFDVAVVINGTARTLRSLLLRDCARLTDATLALIGERCEQLDALDVCGVVNITDEGVDSLARGLADRLTMIVCSKCRLLTDKSLESFGRWCPNLEVLTCRALPHISNAGLDALCKGVGKNLAILDILGCELLKVRAFLDSARRYCPQLARRYAGAEGRNLRQIIISSLSGFIFHVTGSDIHNGRAAVYFLLVDSGTSNSFRVSIGSSSLDLTNYGSILASCFGNAPNELVKQTLLDNYGLDLDADESQTQHDL